MSSRAAITFLLCWPLLLPAQRFFPDDPLLREPPPHPVNGAGVRELNVYVELFRNTFSTGENLPPAAGSTPAQAVNTLGEVLDSAWYTNRHYWNRMCPEELVRGPGNETPPAPGAWKVITGKAEGVTPGFIIEDKAGRRFLLKLDPPNNIELASGAEVVTSKFFHALGYNVPENYIVHFERNRLYAAEDAKLRDRAGKETDMSDAHIDGILDFAPRHPQKGYRAVASLYLSGQRLGQFRFRDTRADDPNDIIPHQHRRDLRGLFVFSAWLAHHDIKELNTVDMLVEEDGVRFIRHYLVDFNGSLGSDSVEPKRPRDGYEYLFSWKPTVKKVMTFGFHVPPWARAEFPNHPSIGRLESKVFDPDKWKPRCPLPPFANRTPEDTFWAAKQVMAFTDDDIRAIVHTGEYTDPSAEQWLTHCLIRRRNKIGHTYFERVLPLDQFHVAGNRLHFTDLAVQHGFTAPRAFATRAFC